LPFYNQKYIGISIIIIISSLRVANTATSKRAAGTTTTQKCTSKTWVLAQDASLACTFLSSSCSSGSHKGYRAGNPYAR